MFYKLTKEELEELNQIKSFSGLKNIQIQKGWIDTLKELGNKIVLLCENENIDFPKINQIKSKFGTLRFYYHNDTKNQKLEELIKEYHSIFDNTCEICGRRDETVKTMITDNSFVITVCEEHTKEHFKELKTNLY
jgi:hypothetical protein